MRRLLLTVAACAAIAAIALLPSAAQVRGKGYVPPRATGGKADLQGIWQARNAAAFDLESHTASLGIPAGASVIVDPQDGHIPYLPAAASRRKENFKNLATADPLNKCFLAGVPRTTYLPFPLQIFQTAKYVILLSEYVHTTRTIYLDRSTHPDDIDFWMGDSRGHWEGDALVVDVANNNGDTWLDASGNFHSDALRVTERFTRTAPDVLTYQATLEDPKTYAKPWTMRMPLYRNAEKGAQLLEYECASYREEEQSAGRTHE